MVRVVWLGSSQGKVVQESEGKWERAASMSERRLDLRVARGADGRGATGPRS